MCIGLLVILLTSDVEGWRRRGTAAGLRHGDLGDVNLERNAEANVLKENITEYEEGEEEGREECGGGFGMNNQMEHCHF